MMSNFDYYPVFLKKLNTISRLHLNNIKGIKGFLYKYYSLRQYMNYMPMNEKTQKSIEADDNDYIVSLTTYGSRTKTVHITLDSIFRQTLRPSKVVLWLSRQEYPNKINDLPDQLRERYKNIDSFDIKFCDDLKPHKKYYECMLQNPTKIIITCDDDVFYPANWLLELNKLHKKFPDCICCTNAHKITFNNNREIDLYSNWIHLTEECGPSLLLCPVGVGGVLYPPNTLDKRLFDKVFIQANCLNADDLWLKSMSILNNTKVVKCNKYPYTFLNIPSSSKNALSKTNVLQKRNDEQLLNILKVYRREIMRVLFQ